MYVAKSDAVTFFVVLPVSNFLRNYVFCTIGYAVFLMANKYEIDSIIKIIF